MPATVAWDGFGRVDNADTLTGWNILKVAGTGGAPTLVLADSPIQGAGAVTTRVNKQHDVVYFDLGAGNELDFSGGGAEEGQLIYIWGQFLASGLLRNVADGGFGIFLESSTPSPTQFHEWYFYGADNYASQQVRLVLDPTKAASASAGTAINLASIRYIGLFASVGNNTGRFDNLVVDAIDVGTGLRVYGTSTTDALFDDLLANEATNKYGVVTQSQGVTGADTGIEIAGILKLGDDVGTNAANLTGVNRSLYCAQPLYYSSGMVPSCPVDAFGVACVGNGTGSTTIQFGKKVGTDAGRNGYTFVGNSDYQFSIDWDDGNVNSNKWYDCKMIDCTGPLSWGTNTAHEGMSLTFSGCSQFDPVGGPILRSLAFANLWDDGTTTNQAALLWNASIDLVGVVFANNTLASARVGHDMEVTVAGTINPSNFKTSGAEQEILFSAASGNLTVNNVGGSNFSTTSADHTVTGTGSITVVLSVSHTLTGIVENSEVTYVRDSDSAELFHVENVTASGTTVYAYDGGLAGTAVTILIFKEDQKAIDIPITLAAVDESIPIQQEVDRDYAA